MQQQGHSGAHMGMGMMGHHPGVTQAYMQQQQREMSRINGLANATYNGAREIGEQKAEVVEM
jgi:hemoglobin-like flavoprotein